MNQKTKQYCMDRVHAIAARKIAEIKEKYTYPGVSLSKHEKIDLIYSDNPPPRVDIGYAKNEYRCGLTEAFEWGGYEKPETIDTKKVSEESKLVKDKATFLIDELMLGDAKEASAMIRKFEA